MAKATWRGTVLAESDTYEVVEGNIYFPPASVNRDLLRDSDTHTRCVWKGEASYYDVVVDGEVNKDAAWFYPAPLPAAENVRDHVAFWRGIEVEE